MQNDNFQFDKQRQSQGFLVLVALASSANVRGFLDSCGEAGSGSDSDLARTWEMASLDWNCSYVNVDVESWHYQDMITTVSCNVLICLQVLLIYHARSLEAGLTELGRAVVLRCMIVSYDFTMPAWIFQAPGHPTSSFWHGPSVGFSICERGDMERLGTTCTLDSLGVDSQFARARHFWRWRWSSKAIFHGANMMRPWRKNLNAGYGHNSGRVYQPFSGLSGLAILNISSVPAFGLIFFHAFDWNKNMKKNSMRSLTFLTFLLWRCEFSEHEPTEKAPALYFHLHLQAFSAENVRKS